MAFEEVTLTPEEQAAAAGGGGGFIKFEAIGDKLAGRFVGSAKATNNFGKEVTRYKFKHKNAAGEIVEGQLEPTVALARLLEKAQLKPGNAVIITYTGEQVIEGKDKPMKLYSLKVDRSSGPAAAPKPPPPPPPADDDVAF